MHKKVKGTELWLVAYLNFLDMSISIARVLSTGGGGGEASTPSTISSPPKHNYELIIIHVFVSF